MIAASRRVVGKQSHRPPSKPRVILVLARQNIKSWFRRPRLVSLDVQVLVLDGRESQDPDYPTLEGMTFAGPGRKTKGTKPQTGFRHLTVLRVLSVSVAVFVAVVTEYYHVSELAPESSSLPFPCYDLGLS